MRNLPPGRPHDHPWSESHRLSLQHHITLEHMFQDAKFHQFHNRDHSIAVKNLFIDIKAV